MMVRLRAARDEKEGETDESDLDYLERYVIGSDGARGASSSSTLNGRSKRASSSPMVKMSFATVRARRPASATPVGGNEGAEVGAEVGAREDHDPCRGRCPV